MKTLLIASLLATTTSWAARPLPVEVRYVDCESGDDANDGMVEARPMRTLQAAVDSTGTNVPEVYISSQSGSCNSVTLPAQGATVHGGGAFINRVLAHGSTDASFLIEDAYVQDLTIFPPDQSWAGEVVLRHARVDGTSVVNADVALLDVRMSGGNASGIVYATRGHQGRLSIASCNLANVGDGSPALAITAYAGGRVLATLMGNSVGGDHSGSPSPVIIGTSGDGGRIQALLEGNVILPADPSSAPIESYGNVHLVSIGGQP